MDKDRKTSADSVENNYFPQTTDKTIVNHAKAKYLYLVSQTSLSLDEKTEKTKSGSNIQYKNDKIALIAADLALQYLQKRNMNLTLDSALSESQNLLVRHFEDRWLAREVQVRGRQDVLHGLLLSKKNNTFDIGFGSNFMKKKREEEEKKYRSNTFRSKSLPAGNNLVTSFKEFDENDQNKTNNNKHVDQQIIEKQNNDSDNQSRSNKSKSSKSSKTKKSRKSYQSKKVNQDITNDNEIESKNISSKLDSESKPDSPHTTQNIKRFSKRDAKIDEEQDNILNNQSQSQKTSNGSGSNNNICNTTNSNILPSPLKTTYSGREDESENNSNNFGTDDEIKTHTYQYSTIYSDEEATHETRFEYETIEQLTDSNDYNSKTYEYSQGADIPPQNSNHHDSNANKNDDSVISASPNINNYTSTSYLYYTYTTNNESEYSNAQQNQPINLKNPIPPKKRQQQEDLELQFPFVQSRDANILSDEDNQQQQQQNTQPQHKKHHDYYYHKHLKKDTKLGFSAPVEFDNPCDFVEIQEDDNHQIEAIENFVDNQENSNTIEEEEIVSKEEKLNEEETQFYIFHAVDIEPDYELQKLFRSKAKQTKGKFTSSVLEEINESLQSSQKRQIKEKTDIKSSSKINQPTVNSKKPKIEEREIILDSSPEVQKDRKFKNYKRTEDEANILYVNNKCKNLNRNQTYKHQHHGSIKRGSQIVDNIDNSKLSQLSNIKNNIRKSTSNLSSGVSSLIVIPSSSSAASIYYSTADQKKRTKSNRNADQIEIEKNRKTKFSNKLVSSKNDNTKKVNKSLKEGKNSSTSLGSILLDIDISDYSNAGLSLDKICEAISEDELLEMSDAPSVSFD